MLRHIIEFVAAVMWQGTLAYCVTQLSFIVIALPLLGQPEAGRLFVRSRILRYLFIGLLAVFYRDTKLVTVVFHTAIQIATQIVEG